MTDKSDCPTQVADGERRSIAWRLRDYAADDLGGMSFQKRLAAVCGVKDASWRVTMRRVADLIDRPTTTLTEDEDGRTCCANCGCAALYMSDATYCPDCGARVVKTGD